MTLEGVAQVARGFERVAFLLFLLFATFGAVLMFAAVGGFTVVDRTQTAGLLVMAFGALLVATRALLWATK